MKVSRNTTVKFIIIPLYQFLPNLSLQDLQSKANRFFANRHEAGGVPQMNKFEQFCKQVLKDMGSVGNLYQLKSMNG